MKKTYILIILFLLFFTNCKEKQSIEIIKTVEFNTGIVDIYWRFKGIYYDNDYNREVVYFSDFGKSYIKTFNLQGKILDIIPLKNVVQEFAPRDIGFIYPYSIDTIFCGKHLENQIVVINHKGDIYHTINIDNIVPDSLKKLYCITQREHPYQGKNSNKIILHPMLNYQECLLRENKTQLDLIDGHEIYFNNVFHNSPYFFELKNIFSDKIDYDFKYRGFYEKYFIKNDVAMSNNIYFKELNNFIFIMFNSKNLILKINHENFELLETINIKSKYTDLGYSYTIKENLNKSENKMKSLYQGRICELFFNEKTKQYIVIVMHAAKDKEEYDSYNEFDYRPFSVIVYDENFKNPKEYKFEANTYICRNSFMSQEGLWLQRKPENLTKENYGTQTFDLIKFN